MTSDINIYFHFLWDLQKNVKQIPLLSFSPFKNVITLQCSCDNELITEDHPD